MAMDLNAKAAYIRGLMTGMDFDADSKNGKVIAAMMDLLEEMAAQVTEHDNALDQVYDELETLDQDLDDVVSDIYADEDEDDEEDAEDDSTMYEVTCPNCGQISTLEALAAAHTGEGTVLCALDARRAQVYSAAFDLATHTRLLDDDARAVADLAQFVENCKKPLFFVGDGASLCYNKYGSVPGVPRRCGAAVLLPWHWWQSRWPGTGRPCCPRLCCRIITA